ncbi:MAG: hypothetical protein IJS09_04295 [Treponema sp.]|nr:hypothetical protein [Treponema sp.]
MDELTRNYEWFDKNREKIIEGHHSQYVLIKDETVISYFNSEQEGIKYVNDNNIPFGTFALQRCLTEKEETGYYANWAVRFA